MTAVDNPDYVTGYTPGGSIINFLASGPIVPTGFFNTPVVSCVAFQALFLQTNVFGIQPCTISVSFFADPGGSISLGLPLNYKKTAATSTTFVVPVLGPYFKVTVNNTGAANITNVVVLCAGLISAGATVLKITGLYTLIDQQSTALAGSATVNLLPTNPFTANSQCLPGKAKLWFQVNQTGQVLLQMWNGTTWDIMALFNAVASTPQIQDVALPLSDWRIQVINGTAVATVFFAGLVLQD